MLQCNMVPVPLPSSCSPGEASKAWDQGSSEECSIHLFCNLIWSSYRYVCMMQCTWYGVTSCFESQLNIQPPHPHHKVNACTATYNVPWPRSLSLPLEERSGGQPKQSSVKGTPRPISFKERLIFSPGSVCRSPTTGGIKKKTQIETQESFLQSMLLPCSLFPYTTLSKLCCVVTGV